jgi:predicted nuclease of predicted toxin-antitoxin system
MNFLVDAQLPRLLAVRLRELGQQACHTLDLAEGNQTSDQLISHQADQEGAVVITKDADFMTSHLLFGKPAKLLLVSTGNIPNRKLLGLFETHIDSILSALSSSSFVEITGTGLISHD